MGTKAVDKTQRLKRAFLAAYAESGVVSFSADAAGCNRSLHYRWMDSDDAYAAEFRESHEKAIETLELEARRRALHGVKRLVTHQGRMVMVPKDPSNKDSELIPLVEHEYSDTLTIFLLKAAKPEKYRENAKIELTGAGGGPVKTENNHTFDNDRFADLYRSRTRRNQPGAGSPSLDRN